MLKLQPRTRLFSSLNSRYYKLLFLLFLVAFSQAANAVERKKLFNSGWRFHLGAVEHANSFAFNDLNWRNINLPHDWSVEPIKDQIPGKTIGPFSKESIGGAATGQTVGGEGWYRKEFTLAKQDEGKRHELYFEGVYNQSEIWINGKKVNENVYGYSTFRFDITPFCNPAGQKNVIAVRVINKGKNSRWYAGSGIYRNVYMITTGRSYIDDWLTSVETSSLSQNQASLSITTTVINPNLYKDLLIHAEILTPAGKVVSHEKKVLSSGTGDTAHIAFDFKVNNPELWNIETPSLYTLKLTLANNKVHQDLVSIPFGIRTLTYSVDKGLQINGNTIKLKGGCIHHDNGLLGAAAYDRAEEKKIQLLKANGFIAIRSHNPMSESFMRACDRMGMLVVNEAFDQWEKKKNPDDYHQYFKEWSAKDIRSLVLRDRNKPSVIMWSIGNEIYERLTERGMELASYLRNEVLKYDKTRPITAGVNNQWDKERVNRVPIDNAFRYLDVAGYNYMWQLYERDHERFPERIMFGSESVAKEAADYWRMVEKLPYVIGDFTWTAMDYLGESGLGNSIEVEPTENTHFFMDWPWYNGWCGDIDLLGVKKPQSYYRDIVWDQRRITMAVEMPVTAGKIKKVSFWGWADETMSWNFPDKIGQQVYVNVYSKAPKIKLFLNGKFIAEENTDTIYKASFKMDYQPGELKAVEVMNGKDGQATMLTTPGEKRFLSVSADRNVITADGQDLSYVMIELVDENGQVIMDSDRKIALSLQGNGAKIVGSGNGAPNDMESFNSLEPKLFNGRAMVILRAGYKKAQTTLNVTSDGIKDSSIKIRSK